jgi:hypothetical protein
LLCLFNNLDNNLNKLHKFKKLRKGQKEVKFVNECRKMELDQRRLTSKCFRAIYRDINKFQLIYFKVPKRKSLKNVTFYIELNEDFGTRTYFMGLSQGILCTKYIVA